MKKLLILYLIMTNTALAALPNNLTTKFLSETNPSSVSFEGHWSVVFFLQTSCPCSNSHLGHVSELTRKYKNVTFIGVHADGYTASAEAKSYFEAKNLPFKIVDDNDFKWTELFKAMKTPQAFLISPKGEIVYEGAISNSANFQSAKEFYLKELLEAVSAGKSVPFEHKRSLGCYITRERKS